MDQLQIQFEQGLALHRQGDLVKAKLLYEEVIQRNPNHFDALHLLGAIAAQHQDCEAALGFFEKALAVDQSAASIFYNRGNVYSQIGYWDLALADFNRAIEKEPTYAQAYSNRGIVLQELGRVDEAMASHDRAVTLEPLNPYAYFNRGVVREFLKMPALALLDYDQAIACDRRIAKAHLHRANVLMGLMQLKASEEGYLEVLKLDPENMVARWSLVFLTLSALFLKKENPQEVVEAFTRGLEKFNNGIDDSNIHHAYQVVGLLQPFYLAYQELNNKEVLSKYGALCHRLMDHWQVQNNIQTIPPSRNGKIRIGIVSDHIRNHSVWSAIIKGWVTNIDLDKFELHIFYLGQINDPETQFAKTQSTSFTQGNLSLRGWIDAIRDKGVDVLIYPEIGMNLLATQLANLRIASLQLTTWGHPETSGLPALDYFISADLFENAGSEELYTESLLKLPNLGCHYERVPVLAGDIDLQQLGLMPDEPILLCPGTPYKFAAKNDWVFLEIAKRLGKCKLVFFSTYEHWNFILKERLRKVFEAANLRVDDFVIFVPWQTEEGFYGLMKKADVFMDPIGFSGFNTAMQAVDCALPIVTREGSFLRGRLASGILKRMGLSELVATTEEGYISLVVRLVQDAQYNRELRQRMADSRGDLYGDLMPIRALEDFLLAKCRQG